MRPPHSAHRSWFALLLMFAPALAMPAWAIINPTFTPTDLIRASLQIVLLEVPPPKDGVMTAQVIETLRGPAWPQKTLRIEWDRQDEAVASQVAGALGGDPRTHAILLLNPKGSAIQIGTHWFAVEKREDRWILQRDGEDRFSVWAGSAAMLARAVRYVATDARAHFPVRSEMSWGGDLRLGRLAGKANGCLVADFGGAIGFCAVVLCDGGDRIYQIRDGRALDITVRTKLSTASRVATTGDFNGDGRLDLALWDGKLLQIASQGADGTFSTRAVEGLTDCVSLSPIAAGTRETGLVAGTSQGPVLIVSNERGTYTARPVGKSIERLGSGGYCVVADFSNDGRCDLMQLFSSGMLFWSAEVPGRFAAPVELEVPLVKNPSAAVCGDFDADGQLDLVVTGEAGIVLLGREGDRWQALTHITGELAYHGNANRPNVSGSWPADINNDGRQGLALLYADRNPMLFFNRGFACFGLARELALSDGNNAPAAADAADPFGVPSTEAKLPAAEALQRGQLTGAILDINGDGVPDLLGVDLKGEVWALLGKRAEGRTAGVSLVLPASAQEAVTVRLIQKKRTVGMYLVRPGVPATAGRADPAPLTVQWTSTDGTLRTQSITGVQPTRVEIAP